jgi:excisionase family DNA binding protein
VAEALDAADKVNVDGGELGAPREVGIGTAAVKSAQKITIPLSERPTLTVNEFCTMIGIGRSTFYKAVAAGHLQVRKYGKRTLITREEMKRFVENMPSG